jgi:Flp pilus assembly protein TadD
MLSRLEAQRRAWVCALALVLLVAVVFARALSNGFVSYDTSTYLTENAHVRAGLTWSGVRWAFTTFYAANWHPLTWMSHMVDVSVFGLRPACHHAINVAFHAANSVLLFLVLVRWTGREGVSFAVAALFAVHPLHVESVAWIVERKDVLSACFGLAALLAWTGWARDRSRGAYCCALVLFAAALMSKPMLVTLPFVMLLADVWPLRRKARGWAALVGEKLPFFALSAASCIVTWRAQVAGGAMQTFADLPLATRAGTAIASCGWYASKSIWPSGLVFHYPLDASGVHARNVVGGAAVLVAGTVVGIAQRRRRPWVLCGWLLFLGMLVPVLGLVQVGGQAHADRYAYLPVLGLLVASAWTIDDLAMKAGWKIAFAVAVVATFGVVTTKQVGAWKDDAALARHALDVDPENAVAHDVLGWTLFRDGQVKEGLAHLKRALELSPGDPDARRNAGRALHRLGKLEEAETSLRMAIASGARDPLTFIELGSVLAEQGRSAEALDVLAFATGNNPSDVGLRTTYGEVLLQAGRPAQAEIQLRAALALAPDHLRAEVDLARVLIDTGRQAEAEPLLRAALAAEPANPQALQQLARVQLARGEIAPAIASLRAAIEARPGWPVAMADLAWILATANDATLRSSAEALDLAGRAVDSGNRENAEFLDVLAAAQAANGAFDDAVATALDAAQRARQAGDAARAARIELRLAAYREKHMGEGPR